MTFTVTPHGVQAYIPIIEYSKKTYADLSWSGDASLSKLPNAQPSRFLLCLEKDLDSQVKEFERQAGEVREWDKVLVRNGNQVSSPVAAHNQRMGYFLENMERRWL